MRRFMNDPDREKSLFKNHGHTMSCFVQGSSTFRYRRHRLWPRPRRLSRGTFRLGVAQPGSHRPPTPTPPCAPRAMRTSLTARNLSPPEGLPRSWPACHGANKHRRRDQTQGRAVNFEVVYFKTTHGQALTPISSLKTGMRVASSAPLPPRCTALTDQPDQSACMTNKTTTTNNTNNKDQRRACCASAALHIMMAVHGHGQYTGQCAHGPVETRRGVVVSAHRSHRG